MTFNLGSTKRSFKNNGNIVFFVHIFLSLFLLYFLHADIIDLLILVCELCKGCLTQVKNGPWMKVLVLKQYEV